jgi:HK97 gp10 family phage protein
MQLTARVQMTNRLPNAVRKLQESRVRIAERTAQDVVREAQSRAAVATGYMRSTIGYTMQGSTATIGVGATYAPYIEFGTRFMAARPFFTPAAEMARSRFVANAQDEMRDLAGG